MHAGAAASLRPVIDKVMSDGPRQQWRRSQKQAAAAEAEAAPVVAVRAAAAAMAAVEAEAAAARLLPAPLLPTACGAA